MTTRWIVRQGTEDGYFYATITKDLRIILRDRNLLITGTTSELAMRILGEPAAWYKGHSKKELMKFVADRRIISKDPFSNLNKAQIIQLLLNADKNWRFDFQGLPPEIRLMIYENLTTEASFPQLKTWDIYTYNKVPVFASILATNKQVYTEAKDIFLKYSQWSCSLTTQFDFNSNFADAELETCDKLFRYTEPPVDPPNQLHPHALDLMEMPVTVARTVNILIESRLRWDFWLWSSTPRQFKATVWDRCVGAIIESVLIPALVQNNALAKLRLILDTDMHDSPDAKDRELSDAFLLIAGRFQMALPTVEVERIVD